MTSTEEPFPLPDGVLENLGEKATDRESIRDLLTFLNDIVENIPLMVFVKDADELRFQHVNRAAEQVMGYPREELIGQTDFDLFPDEQAEFFVEKDREVLQGQKLVDIPEEKIETPHGTRILHTKKIPILDDDGEPKYLLGISEDITERKAMREELVRADRMASLGRLAAGVAHEISNPLSYVVTDLHVLRERLREKRDAVEADEEWDELLELGEAIESGLDRVSKILSELRTFSRAGGDGGTTVDLGELLETVVSLASAELDSDIEVDFDCRSVPAVRGETARLQQLFMNLFLNAVHATEAAEDPSGQVIEVSTRRRGEMVAVAIRDTGEGMAEEELEHVFDPFYTTRPVGEGTGLGLSICHGIVTSMGGEIDIESTVGQGTTVTVRLPVAS